MAATGRQTVAAVLVAAGSGQRLGADRPKAFVGVGDRSILEHALARFVAHPRVRDVVVVVPDGSTVTAVGDPVRVRFVAGGVRRQDSVANGLAALAPDVDHVLVHDAARPFVPAAVIDRVLDALLDRDVDGAVPVVPVADTLRRLEPASGALGATVDREQLAAMQTPQGFRRAALLRAHDAGRDTDVTDDVALVQAIGGRVVAVDGDDASFKITRPWDLDVAAALIDELAAPGTDALRLVLGPSARPGPETVADGGC